jgi:hypothetical protein
MGRAWLSHSGPGEAFVQQFGAKLPLGELPRALISAMSVLRRYGCATVGSGRLAKLKPNLSHGLRNQWLEKFNPNNVL